MSYHRISPDMYPPPGYSSLENPPPPSPSPPTYTYPSATPPPPQPKPKPYEEYPPPGVAYHHYPQQPEEYYPPPSRPSGPYNQYQGYFEDGYPPPPSYNNNPNHQPPGYYSQPQQHYQDHQDESSDCLSFLQGCYAALCCYWLLDECCS